MSVTLLDVKGLACPLPVLRAKRALKDMPPGDVLRVLATDPGALKDIPAFCAQTGHQLLGTNTEQPGLYVFDIKRTE